MACKPKPQLRMADGGELMRRFANRQPVRMADGGDPFQQMLGRNPGVEANRVASPSPGLTTPAAPQVAALAAPPQFGPGRVDDTQNAARTARMAMYGRASDNANAITAMSNPTAPAADPGRRERMLAAGQRTQTFMPTMGNIQTEAFDPHIRQLVLRDGGTVPGKGTGDKIPALYEPGEFVVSNAMLDAEPGLREQLHDLRGNVLAAQGKSVEQADAQAVKGGTLRAASGGALPKLPSLDFLDKRPAPAPAPIQAALRTPAQVPVVRSAIADAMERAVSKHPMGWQAAPAAPNFETLPGAAGPNNSIKFAVPPEPVNATTSLGANTAEARGMTRTAPAPAPNLTAMNQPGVDSRNAQFAERSAYEARAAREANPRSMTTKELFSRGDGSVRGSSPLRFNPPGMGPNGVVQTANAPRSMTRAELFNQPKSSIPNNPAGPLKLPTPVAAEPTGRVAKGLAWVDDAMSAAAKSKFVAPVLGALRSPLGQAVGKLGGVGAQLALHHGNAGAPTLDDERVAAMGRPYDPDWQPRSKPYTPRPDSVTPWGNELRRNSPMAGVNGPTAPARGTEDFTKALSTVPDQLPAGLRDGMVYKTKDAKGNVTYSGRNVSGDVSERMLNGDGTSAGKMRGTLRVAAGAPVMGPNGSYVIDDQAPTGEAKQAQINATLRNPDGSTWSARDNAVMAANLRDGVDPYRGTSRAAPEEERIPAIGEFGHNKAVAAKAERERNKATLRGQDINMQVAMAPAKLAAANRDLIMNVMGHKSIGNDPARGAAYLTSVGRPDLAEGLQKQADASLKMAAESDTLVNNKWKDMQDQFKGQYMNPDKNGTPEANAGLEARAFARLKRTNPEAFRLDPTKRSEAIRDAIADEELMQAFGNPRDAGFASMLPEFLTGNRLDDRTHEIPGKDKLRGTQISDRVGGLRGALSPSLEGGDYMLRTPAGRQTLNLGKLSADAKARLQRHIDDANK